MVNFCMAKSSIRSATTYGAEFSSILNSHNLKNQKSFFRASFLYGEKVKYLLEVFTNEKRKFSLRR